MATRYDLAVAYRIYPKTSKTPAIFAGDKYRLAELCLRSFRASLGGLKVKLWAILDGCPPEYEELFKKYFGTDDLELVRMNGVGNAATFSKQVEILSHQSDAEFIYFAEDDYFYLPGQFEELLAFMKANRDVQFVSAYDHPDAYSHAIARHSNYLKIFNGRHWRTAESTCMTFLATRQTLNATRAVFMTYARGNFDCSIWLSLTKYKLFNPFAIARYLVRDRETFTLIAKAWLYCWTQILFGKRRKLWAPIPSIATHMEKEFLAPGIDWMKLFDAPVDVQARPT